MQRGRLIVGGYDLRQERMTRSRAARPRYDGRVCSVKWGTIWSSISLLSRFFFEKEKKCFQLAFLVQWKRAVVVEVGIWEKILDVRRAERWRLGSNGGVWVKSEGVSKWVRQVSTPGERINGKSNRVRKEACIHVHIDSRNVRKEYTRNEFWKIFVDTNSRNEFYGANTIISRTSASTAEKVRGTLAREESTNWAVIPVGDGCEKTTHEVG